MEKKAQGLVSGGKEWDRKDGRGPGLRRERMDKKAEGLFSEVIERRDTAEGRESEWRKELTLATKRMRNKLNLVAEGNIKY